MEANDAQPRPTLLVVEEVAELLRTSDARIYRLAREGRIAGIVRLGRQLRFERAALLEWIANGGYKLPGGWRSEPAGVDLPRPVA